MKTNVWYIENINLYKAFCPHKFKDFRQQHEYRSYRKDDFIFFADEPAQTIYMIAEGKVKVSMYLEDGTEIVKAILGKGEVFGEMALLGIEKRNEFARVMEEGTLVCTLDLKTLMQLMLHDVEFALSIHKLIGWRVMKLERRISTLLFKSVKQRLMEFIKDLANERGEQKNDCLHIRHHLTQQNIADLIGTSRQTLNQLMNELKEEGILDFNRKEIFLYEGER